MHGSSEYAWRPTRFVQASLALHLLALVAVLIRPSIWPWALGIVIANHLLITAVGLWPRSRWLGANWVELPEDAAPRNQIALTIDDGPDPEVTPQVLDVLDRYGVKATFFCIGVLAERHAELCRDIVRRGHAVENHSQYHRHHFSLLGPAGVMREIRAAQQTLTDITGQPPQFFRAPAGLRNPFLAPVLVKLGLQLASWTVRGFDTQTGDAGKVTTRLLAKLRPGAILLLHDGHAARTAQGRPVILDVLPRIIDEAGRRGLHFIRLRDARPVAQAAAPALTESTGL
ncbi:polysaccharide deacetylase [Novimethylophilus kurashikiensis]|uniref:Polysaccharide deacetylase n=1 Tax=Novimethylophilus kurashikiensis TaxID=1825523 RepID=A0A2R5FIK5_9PROT|nr:polysaccharide deacetylase family protein [Novimethylophilus kurashikiensis]GBG15781.1 polysaccharide deacetylase [Novimethylophilus kurashikiensis]